VNFAFIVFAPAVTNRFKHKSNYYKQHSTKVCRCVHPPGSGTENRSVFTTTRQARAFKKREARSALRCGAHTNQEGKK